MMYLIKFICEWIRVTIKMTKPGGKKALIAEILLLRQQLIAVNRKHQKFPKMTTMQRIFYGLLGSWIHPNRLSKIAIIIKPSTIIKFHKALVKRKYNLLFSNKSAKNPEVG